MACLRAELRQKRRLRPAGGIQIPVRRKKRFLHGDVLMGFEKTLTSRRINQRGAGHLSGTVDRIEHQARTGEQCALFSNAALRHGGAR